MAPRIRALMTLGLAGFTLHCGGETVRPADNPLVQSIAEDIEVVRVAGGIRLSNGGAEALAFVAWNPEWLGQIAMCIDRTTGCLRLGAHASVLVPESELLGFDPAAPEVIVRVWRVVQGGTGGQGRAEVIGEVTVPLR